MKRIFYRESSFTVIALGVLIELIGLCLDAFLHLQNETLAAREGVFTLANPGHFLFIAGLVLTVLGVMMHTVPRLQKTRWIAATIGLALSISALVGVSGVAFATPTHNHLHADHGVGGMITYTDKSDINVSWEQLREIDSMLGKTKAATDKYRDVNVARADGYMQLGPNRRGVGAHFLNPKILDAGTFDITRPTILLYEHKLDWSFELVGVSWMLPKQSGDDTPPPYFAPLAAWHYHEYDAPGLCIWDDGSVGHYAETLCATEGGKFWRTSPWMLHVWLFRPSPDGIFSTENRNVGGIQAD